MPFDCASRPSVEGLTRAFGQEILPEPALGALRAWSPLLAGANRESAGGRRPREPTNHRWQRQSLPATMPTPPRERRSAYDFLALFCVVVAVVHPIMFGKNPRDKV